MNWLYHVRIKHLFTEAEDFESVQASMNSIADIISKELCFSAFSTAKFRSVPRGDDIFHPIDYANKLLDKLYDFADNHAIWLH
jgi:hypothetical protein